MQLNFSDKQQKLADRARRRGGNSSRRGERSSRIFPQTQNHLQRHQAQSQPSLDRPPPEKRRGRIIVFYERGYHPRPACPTWRVRIWVFAVKPPKQPEQLDPYKVVLPDKTRGLRHHMIYQCRSCFCIAVAGAARLIAKNMI